MRNIKTLIVALTVGVTTTGLMASQMRIESTAGVPGYSASGASLTDSGANAFTFQVGTFESFTPTATNVDDWSANWVSAGLQSSWIVSGPFANRVRNQYVMMDDSFTGKKGFIWGFDDSTDVAGGQWILVTNDAWVFPAVSPLELPNNINPANVWSLNDPNNIAIVGSFLNGNPAEGFQLQAIPEPSTYALILGLGILGFLGYRRVRK